MNDRKFLQYNRVRQEHTLHKIQSAKGLFPDFGGKAKSFQSVQSFRISGVQNVQSAKGDLPEIRETLSNPGRLVFQNAPKGSDRSLCLKAGRIEVLFQYYIPLLL